MAVWTIKGGGSGEYEDAFLEKGVVAIGFGLTQSIANFASRDALRSHVEGESGANQLWRFCNEVEIGDMVALPRKRTKQIAVGRISGPYAYQAESAASGAPHTRSVDWQVTDIPRSHFDQDLLNSFNSLLTLSQPRPSDAEARIRQTANVFMELEPPGIADAPPAQAIPSAGTEEDSAGTEQTAETNLDQIIQERIIARLRRQYAGSQLEDLVASILQANGYHVLLTQKGADGGVDVLAGKGDMGFGEPRLCVQVKGRTTSVNLNEYSSLQGNITAFGADHGLLVSLGGFTKPVLERNEQQSFFAIRLWGPEDLAERLLESYDSLPQDIRADFREDIPLDTVQVLRRGEPVL